MTSRTSIVWFRQDLRLDDNPSLDSAVKLGGPVIPVYIWSPQEEGQWGPGPASQWWLHQSLASLDSELHRLDSRLVVQQGSSLETLMDLIRETDAEAVFWNRRYEPEISERDLHIERQLASVGVRVETTNASLLFEPWEVRKEDGSPYQVFSAFWRRCMANLTPACKRRSNNVPVREV